MADKKMVNEFSCKRCGNCCKEYGDELPFTEDDEERWWEMDRLDIIYNPFLDWDLREICSLRALGWYNKNDAKKVLKMKEKEINSELNFKLGFKVKFLWGGMMNYCPFLKWESKKKYNCLIHEVKPEICKNYPFEESGIIRFEQRDICPAVRYLEKQSMGKKDKDEKI